MTGSLRARESTRSGLRQWLHKMINYDPVSDLCDICIFMNVKGINKQRNIDVGKDREGLIGLTVGALDKLCSGRQEDVSSRIH